MDQYVQRTPRASLNNHSNPPNAPSTPRSLPKSSHQNPHGTPRIGELFVNDPINPGPCEGFDRYAGKRWIYPNNMTIRGYQRNAVERSLFANSMIVLPTGFGKTFIAAVVMYNYYRWYPQGKIIFVAPTKPLVNQQINECKKISGIPASDCIQLTGTTGREKRSVAWVEKRVFFATPQVIENDLETGNLPAKKVRCIVIDEAHRAQGNFAYVGIVRYLHEANRNGFRIVALSATPGSDIERVKQVLLNLYIKELVFRSENSIDLMQYKNEKISKAWTVELTGKHQQIVDKFKKVADPVILELYKAGLTYNGDSIDKVAKFTLFSAQTRITNNEGNNIASRKGKLRFYCAAAISLSHNFELLTLYGLRPFYNSVMNNLSESRSSLRTVTAGNCNFDLIIKEIEEMFGEDCKPDANKQSKADLLKGHPKLMVVKQLLMDHFNKNEGKKETRAIVFTKYRDSVHDIVQALKPFYPIIKAGPFVGQGKGNNKSNPDATNNTGMTQREQIKMISDFKAGEYNVLVATCVAEEGLDIGEVDLIICYDTTSSPISNTQRRGRTGRKRSGDVQTLVTKGYEEKKLSKAGKSKRDVEDKLFNKDNYIHTRYRDSPRMVPLDLNPVCLEQKIFPIDDEPQVEEKPKRKRKKNTVEVAVEPNDSSKKRKKCLDSDDDDDFYDGDQDLCPNQKTDSSARKEYSMRKRTSRDFDHYDSIIGDDDLDDLFSDDELLSSVVNTPPIKESQDEKEATTSGSSEFKESQATSVKTQETNIKSEDSDIEWDDDVDFSKVLVTAKAEPK